MVCTNLVRPHTHRRLEAEQLLMSLGPQREDETTSLPGAHLSACRCRTCRQRRAWRRASHEQTSAIRGSVAAAKALGASLRRRRTLEDSYPGSPSEHLTVTYGSPAAASPPTPKYLSSGDRWARTVGGDGDSSSDEYLAAPKAGGWTLGAKSTEADDTWVAAKREQEVKRMLRRLSIQDGTSPRPTAAGRGWAAPPVFGRTVVRGSVTGVGTFSRPVATTPIIAPKELVIPGAFQSRAGSTLSSTRSMLLGHKLRPYMNAVVHEDRSASKSASEMTEKGRPYTAVW